MSGWLKYSGKPGGSVDLPKGKYTLLDVVIPAPPASKKEDRMIYLNVKVNWKLPKSHQDYYRQVANLRVYWARATRPVDETAYQDYTITPIKSSFLITHVHWEHGQKNIGGRWYAEISGRDCTGATVLTRYSKGAM